MIESKDNKKIKYINKLRNNKFMCEEEKFIVEGKHLVMEAYQAGILLETYSLDDVNYGVENIRVSQNIMNYISTLPSSSNVLGICKFTIDKTLGSKIIILDNVQDPGNIGTIIRSANAFGFDSVILGIGSAFKYNEKLIRASQGMLFKTNVISSDIEKLIPFLKNNGYNVYGTDVVNGINVSDVKTNDKIAVILGNEGTGISQNIKNMVDKNIYVKINETCESLNVAVAASIIMYEIGKGK